MTMTMDTTEPAVALERRPDRVRVSLREVREVAYRALVAHGACVGRAPAVAEQVLEAELHHGAGIESLLADLARGPWEAGGLDLSENGDGVVTVASADADSPLRVGHLLADLAVAVGAVHAPALRDPWPLMEAPLLESAAAGGRSLGLLRRGADAVAEAWVAAPDGALVTLTGPAAQRLLGGTPPPAGALVLAVDPPPGAAAVLRADERRERRRTAAADGLLVDAALFDRAYAASRAYLVPER